MNKDRQEAAQKRRAVVRLLEARPKRARAPGSGKLPESAKAAGAGGTKSAPEGDAKAWELPSPGKRLADFGTDICVDDYLAGKGFF
jgi:hypothetical protein